MFLPLRIVTTFMIASYLQCSVRDYADLAGGGRLLRCGNDRGEGKSPSITSDPNLTRTLPATLPTKTLVQNNSSVNNSSFILPPQIPTLPSPTNAESPTTFPLPDLNQHNFRLKPPPPVQPTTNTSPAPFISTTTDDASSYDDENEYLYFVASTARISTTTGYSSSFLRPRQQQQRSQFDNSSTFTTRKPTISHATAVVDTPPYFNWNRHYYFSSPQHPRRHHNHRIYQNANRKLHYRPFTLSASSAAVNVLSADYGLTDNNELIVLPHEFDDDADSTQNFHLYGFGLDHYHALMRLSPANHTEETCPRNYEGLLVSPRVRCYKPCTGRDNCKSRRRICACDFDCGLSCVLRGKKCAYTVDDLNIVNGFVSKVGENVFRYGKLRYHCNDGYRLYTGCEGCAAARYCQGDGTWSGRAPLCLQDTECGPPPRKKAAEAIYDRYKGTFAVGHTVSYRCRNGYILRGFARAECVIDDVVFTARWSLSSFSCDPVSCGHPGGLENGYIEIEQGLHYGGKVRYHCNDGYLLGEGSATLYCKADGSWEGIKPRCTPINCPRPAPPENGYFADGSSVRTIFGSKVRFRCNPGFRFRDPNNAERVCLANGTWSGMPARCFEVDCGPIAPIPNGHVVEGSSTRLYSRIEFACDQFAIPDPNRPFINSSVCMPNGEWSHSPPVCLAACLLPKIEHGLAVPMNPKAADDLGGASVVRHGAEINITCDDRFELQVRAVMTAPPLCQNGTFTSIAKCLPRKCPKLELGHQFAGVLLAPSLEHGAIARFVCNRGFSLSYNQSITTAAATAAALYNSTAVVAPLDGTVRCFYGEWIGPRPECNALECMPPGPTANGTIVNGKAFLVGELGRYEYMPYIRNVGQDRQIVYLCVDDYDEDASSGRDYYLKGPSAATCIDGSWSPSDWPECVPEACELPWAAGVQDISVKTLFTSPAMTINKRNSSLLKFSLRTATMPELKSSSLSSSPYSPFIPTANFTTQQLRKQRRRRRKHKKINRDRKRKTRAIAKQGSPPSSGQRPPLPTASLSNVTSGQTQPRRAQQTSTPVSSAARARTRQPVTATSTKVKPTKTARRHIEVRMTCLDGFFVNVDNGSATCHLGEWFPAEPKCVPYTCRVPAPPNMGFFKMQRQNRRTFAQQLQATRTLSAQLKSEEHAVEDAILAALNSSTKLTENEADWTTALMILKQAHTRPPAASNEYVVLKTGDIVSNRHNILLDCYDGYYEAIEELTCIDGKLQSPRQHQIHATTMSADGIANAQCMPKSCQLPEMPEYRGSFEIISNNLELSALLLQPSTTSTTPAPTLPDATRVPEHVETNLIQYWSMPASALFSGKQNVLSSGQAVAHDTRIQVRCAAGYEQQQQKFLPVTFLKLGIGNGDVENVYSANKHLGEMRCEFGHFVPEVPRCVHVDLQRQQTHLQLNALIKRRGIAPACPPPPIIYGTFIVRNGVVTSDSLMDHIRFRRGDDIEYFCYDPTHPFLNNSAAVLLAAGSSANDMLPNWRINCSDDGRWLMPADLKAAGVSANDVCRYLRLARTTNRGVDARPKRTNIDPLSKAFCSIKRNQIGDHLSLFHNGTRLLLRNAFDDVRKNRNDSSVIAKIPVGELVQYYCSPLGAFLAENVRQTSAENDDDEQKLLAARARCVAAEQWQVTDKDSAFSSQCHFRSGSTDSPPAILYQSIVQRTTPDRKNLMLPASDENNDGRLFVLPGARLVLDCVWPRQVSQPVWKFSAEPSRNTRRFATNSSLPPGFWADQHRFRLDITHSNSDHSGVYSCSVANFTNSLNVVVKHIACPSLTEEARHKRVDLNTSVNLLGTVVAARCLPGCERARSPTDFDEASAFYENQLKCLASGVWSGTLHQCVPILCSPVYIHDPRVRLIRVDQSRRKGEGRQVGSKLHFQCDQTYHKLLHQQENRTEQHLNYVNYLNHSSSHIECLSTGKWSASVPHCGIEKPDLSSTVNISRPSFA